eukprot:NODE_273_length_11040_cov_1.244036.p8 type:complete len:102 gc:universal NODE_273_length_11040_cov_1.244036:10174-10479(+)
MYSKLLNAKSTPSGIKSSELKDSYPRSLFALFKQYMNIPTIKNARTTKGTKVNHLLFKLGSARTSHLSTHSPMVQSKSNPISPNIGPIISFSICGSVNMHF